MKLASFKRDGWPGFGAVVDGGVIDLTGKIGGASTLKELLEAQAIDKAREYCMRARPDFALAQCSLLPVIPNPNKIICIGVNYAEHAAEAGVAQTRVPVLFAKFRNSLIGPSSPILLPRVSREIDYEGELAVVIGRRCKEVAVRDALDYVAGYSVFNDVSARDLQMQTSQWVAGKALDTFAPMGPGIVPASEIPDPQTLQLRTRVNGTTLQDANTAQMIFPVAELIAFISSIMTLEPGDIIATGTPSGVGFKRTPPVYLKAGDTVEVEIERVGRIRNPVLGPVNT